MNIGKVAPDPATAYVAMAVRLAESLHSAGKGLRVFTNDPDRLLALAGAQSHLLKPEFLAFDPAIPTHLRFYAAHHKLTLFSRFAQEDWPNCFLDLDIILSKGAQSVQRILERPRPLQAWVYDISAQVFPAYSREVVQGDLWKLGAALEFPLWYGGEFILGVPTFHARLAEECFRILPTYLALTDTLHHISDEPVLSAAINNIAHEFSIGDAGDAELIVRYWSGPTLHAQPPISILQRSAFWHLPDMKWALSRRALSATPSRVQKMIRLRKIATSLRRARG